jgi:hypothetical protein
VVQLKRLKALLRQHKAETKQQQQRLRQEREAWSVGQAGGSGADDSSSSDYASRKVVVLVVKLLHFYFSRAPY